MISCHRPKSNSWIQGFIFFKFLVLVSPAFAQEAPPEIEIRHQQKETLQQWKIPCSGAGKGSEKSIKKLQAMGIKIHWDSSCTEVVVQARADHKMDQAKAQRQKWFIHSNRSVFLEGGLLAPVSVRAPLAEVDSHWMSPELHLAPETLPSHSKSKTPKSLLSRLVVTQGAELKTSHLGLKDSDFENQGKVESSKNLKVALEGGTIRNSGEIFVRGVFGVEKVGKKSISFHQFGSIRAQKIELGDLLFPIDQFDNASGGFLKAKRILGEFQQFKNSGSLYSTESLRLLGVHLENQQGTLFSDQDLLVDFIDLNNDQGRIQGSKQTTLRIGELFKNTSGVVSSDGPIELNFTPNSSSQSLGRLVGSELLLTLRHRLPVELQGGELLGKESISIFSDVRVSLPGVQFQTPLLNLSAPDFALDPLTQCGTTVVHCDPKRNFCLKSPLSSEGEIRFLESDFCRYRPNQQEKEAQDSSAVVSVNAVALEPQLTISHQLKRLGETVKDLEVHFGRNRGYASQYSLFIDSQVSSAQGVYFMVPRSSIFIGLDDSPSAAGVYADSLRTFTNHFLVRQGNVSASDAFIAAPGGITIGVLENDPNQFVQAGDQKFPLLRRGNAFLSTARECYIKGPLSCSGTLDVRGNLILDSEKKQYGYSSDIHVKGNLILKGEGDLSLIRHLGQIQHGQTIPLQSNRYSEEGSFVVDGDMISVNPKTIQLYASKLFVDQSDSKVDFKLVEKSGKEQIQFPEEKSDFKSVLGMRKPGFLRLTGPQTENIITSDEIFLLEDEGQFTFVVKNPYYLPLQKPLVDLGIQDLTSPKLYRTPDLKTTESGSSRFIYAVRESAFFSPEQSDAFIESFQNDIVIYDAQEELFKLPEGQVVFSLSPELLLSQVQKAAQDLFKRNFLSSNQPIDRKYLVRLHRNASEYFKSKGFSFEKAGDQVKVPLKVFNDFLKEQESENSYTKPFLFYQVAKDQGVQILKPMLVIPRKLQEKIRSEREGNIFARTIGRFEAGTTIAEMLESLDEGTHIGDVLRNILSQKESVIQAIDEAAARYRTQLETKPPHERLKDQLDLNHTLQSKTIAIATRDDLAVNADQKGNSVALVSLRGKVKIKSNKTRKKTKTGFQDILERRKLDYGNGDVTIKAGGVVETSAVDVRAGSMNVEGQAILDTALMLESASESKSGPTQVSLKKSKAAVSQMKVKGKLRMKAGNHLIFQGTKAKAGSIDLEAGKDITVLGVQNHSESSVKTEKKTGWFLWAGTEKETQTSVKKGFQGASFEVGGNDTQGDEVIRFKAGNNVTIQAPKIKAQRTHVQAKKFKITQGKNAEASSSSKGHENAWWIQQKLKKEEHQTFTPMDLSGEMHLEVSKLEIEQVKGQVLNFLDQLKYDPKKVKVIETLLEEFHHEDETSISAPGPALIVAVTIASSVATAGVGGAIVGSSGTALAAAASAAISSVTSQIATTLTLGILSQQSPGEILGKVLSADTLKGAATAAISAG
ncbi:MAG: hypothetical protein ACO3A2_04735, partial [Bdellovibrionia bacterium]